MKPIFKFQVQHKNTYKTRVVNVSASNQFKAMQELYRCYPNYNLINKI